MEMVENKWELYDSHADFCMADEEITNTVEKLKEQITKRYKEDGIHCIPLELKKAVDVLRPILHKWSDVGASDTEPRYAVPQALIDHCKKLSGETGFRGDWGDACEI